jgi:hypothetical protein
VWATSTSKDKHVQRGATDKVRTLRSVQMDGRGSLERCLASMSARYLLCRMNGGRGGTPHGGVNLLERAATERRYQKETSGGRNNVGEIGSSSQD